MSSAIGRARSPGGNHGTHLSLTSPPARAASGRCLGTGGLVRGRDPPPDRPSARLKAQDRGLHAARGSVTRRCRLPCQHARPGSRLFINTTRDLKGTLYFSAGSAHPLPGSSFPFLHLERPAHTMNGQAGNAPGSGEDITPEAGREMTAGRVALLYRHAHVTSLVSLVTALLLVAVLWGTVAPIRLHVLAALALAITAAHLLLVRRYRRAAPPTTLTASWERGFTLAIAAGGALWGLAGMYLFPVSSLPHQLFIGLVLGGLTAGAVAFLSAVWGSISLTCCPPRSRTRCGCLPWMRLRPRSRVCSCSSMSP